ncbi:hypothetical protein ACFRMN_34390 [Streptomyces sp. NPDC056835]|uniref:hypothetical protein n=1 Tax=Streptomyces sp. NPDC056835 TaxID=3345956 RepID=UPI0036C934AC
MSALRLRDGRLRDGRLRDNRLRDDRLGDSRPVRRPSRTRPSARPLRTELLRGVGPWTGLATAVVIAVTLYSKAPGWQGRWVEATDLLRVTALLLCGPLAVATGCWQGGRERRRRTGELLASLPLTQLRRSLHAVAPAALWPPAGYLVGAAGCLLATWPYTSGGHPFVSLIAADAVALASLGTIGFVVGRLVGWRLTTPLLAVVTYAGLATPTYGESGARWLDPAIDHFYLWDRPVWWFGPASALWTGGLAGAALLAYAARHRVVALLPLALAVAVAVPIARTGDDLWRPDPEAARLVCDDGTPQVCVTAIDRKLLPEVSAALTGLNAKLRGIPGAPGRWIDGPRAPGPGREQLTAAPGAVVRGQDEPRELGRGEAQLPSPAGIAVRGRLPDPALYATWAVGYFFSETCDPLDSEAPGSERATAVNDAVMQWLAPRPDFDEFPWPAASSELKRLEAMDHDQGRAYLTRYLAADRCDPDEVPVP